MSGSVSRRAAPNRPLSEPFGGTTSEDGLNRKSKLLGVVTVLFWLSFLAFLPPTTLTAEHKELVAEARCSAASLQQHDYRSYVEPSRYDVVVNDEYGPFWQENKEEKVKPLADVRVRGKEAPTFARSIAEQRVTARSRPETG